MKKKIYADNRGITLIEMIVAISIGLIILGSVWQFIITSTKTYSSQKDNVDLQVEVQQTMNHLQNLFVDANRSVAYLVGGVSVENDSELEESNTATVKTINIYSDSKVSKIEWNKDTEKITYQEFKVTNGVVETPAAPVAEEEIVVETLAEGVTAFAADVSKVESDRVVKLNLRFEKGSATYEAAKDITLRNQLLASDSVSDIYANDVIPNGVVSVALQIVPDQEITLSQRASYDDFRATINGATAGSMKVMWTIGNQTSRDTSIDIESGEISIGADETPGNIITVTATLASDRRVKASTTVEVVQAVPSITIVESPKYVLRGESYASSIATGRPIQVKIENAEEEYTLSVSNDALEAGIRVDGKTIVIPSKFNTEVEPWFQFELTATTVATPQSSASVYMTVRNPEFVAGASSSGITTGEYMRGQEVTLSADWSASVEVMSETIGGAEVVYDEAVYSLDDLNTTGIVWSYEYETQTGEIKTVAIASGDKSFTVPLDIKTSGATIKVVGVSEKYGTDITDEIVLNVADVSVSLTATNGGVTYSAGQEMSSVAVGSGIILRGDVLLYNNPQIVWTIYEGEGENKTTTQLLTIHTLSNTKQDASVSVDHSQIKLILGKTFTIRVTDELSGIYKEIVFTVQEKVTCTVDRVDSYNYLVLPEDNNQSSFTLPVASGVYFEDGQKGNWGTEIQVEPVNTSSSCTNGNVIFTPVYSTEGNGSTYTYHLDSAKTGEHLLAVSLTRRDANYPITVNGKDMKVYISRATVAEIGNGYDSGDYTEEFTYINFYGTSDNTQMKYKCTYDYDSSGIMILVDKTCTLTVKIYTMDDQVVGEFTKNYTKKWYDSSWK